ncbi:MAG: hypothetical protein R2849_21905 [Thermomicrobiales bacterium]
MPDDLEAVRGVVRARHLQIQNDDIGWVAGRQGQCLPAVRKELDVSAVRLQFLLLRARRSCLSSTTRIRLVTISSLAGQRRRSEASSASASGTR